jgi:predicted amidohydrolase YtcJ
VVAHLARNGWPFRLHSTHDKITRALDVFEKVNRDVPFASLRSNTNHAQTISPRSIERAAQSRRLAARPEGRRALDA